MRKILSALFLLTLVLSCSSQPTGGTTMEPWAVTSVDLPKVLEDWTQNAGETLYQSTQAPGLTPIGLLDALTDTTQFVLRTTGTDTASLGIGSATLAGLVQLASNAGKRALLLSGSGSKVLLTGEDADVMAAVTAMEHRLTNDLHAAVTDMDLTLGELWGVLSAATTGLLVDLHLDQQPIRPASDSGPALTVGELTSLVLETVADSMVAFGLSDRVIVRVITD